MSDSRPEDFWDWWDQSFVHKDDFRGHCQNCFAVQRRGIDPNAAAWSCERCGQQAVVGENHKTNEVPF